MRVIAKFFIYFPIVLIGFSLSLAIGGDGGINNAFIIPVYGLIFFLYGLIVASIYEVILAFKKRNLNFSLLISIPIVCVLVLIASFVVGRGVYAVFAQ